MKKIKSLCLLGFANLGCPAEVVDELECDKKWRRENVSKVNVAYSASSRKGEIDWFSEYQKVHRSMDRGLDKIFWN